MAAAMVATPLSPSHSRASASSHLHEYAKPDIPTLKPRGMYQLLGLVAERGSGGVVDKFIITQESVGRLVQVLAPGAFKSITQIDFAALDSVLLKPIGVYGSRSALSDFLYRAVYQHSQSSGARPEINLATGLYFIAGRLDGPSRARRGYVIYWPEITTWDDDCISSVKRNRVTFMRYLTKITHQVVALLSDEHTSSLVWNEALTSDEASSLPLKRPPPRPKNRFFSFNVERLKERAESISTRPGSTITLPSSFIEHQPESFLLSPRLAPGDARQALISGRTIPSRWRGVDTQKMVPRAQIEQLLRDLKRTIELGERLEQEAVSNLLSLGLRDRHADLIHEWRKDVAETRSNLDGEIEYQNYKLSEAFKADFGRLKAFVERDVLNYVGSIHPWAALRPNDHPAPSETIEPRHQLESIPPEFLSGHDFHSIESPNFQQIKTRFIIASNAVRHQLHVFPPGSLRDLDKAIISGGKKYNSLVTDVFEQLSSPSPSTKGLMRKIGSAFRKIFGGDHTMVKGLLRRGGSSSRDDPVFMQSIVTLTLDWRLYFPQSIQELQMLASKYLASRAAAFTLELARQISADQLKSAQEVSEVATKVLFEDIERERFVTFRTQLNQAEKNRQKVELLVIFHALSPPVVKSPVEGTTSEEYRVSTTFYSTDPEHSLYEFQTVDLTAEDQQAIMADADFIPRPIAIANSEWSFRIPQGSTLKATYNFSNKRWLVVIVDLGDSKARFYLESDASMTKAIIERKAARHIDLSRVGEDFLISIDEVKRIVVILSRLDNRLFIYSLDELFTGFRLRSELDVFRVVDGAMESIVTMALIPGKEELAIIDDLGR